MRLRQRLPSATSRVRVPRRVPVALALTVASWIVAALWPPPTAGPLAAGGVSAVLAVAVLLRHRGALWALVAWTALKVVGDVIDLTVGIAVPLVMIAMDATAIALLLSPATVRWVQRPDPPLPFRLDQHTAPSGVEEFTFDWRPTFRDWERVLKAKRRVEGLVWMRWILPGIVLAVFAVADIRTDPVGILIALLAIAVGTGWLDYARRRFTWRRRHDVGERTVSVLHEDAAQDVTGHTFQRTEWPGWAACIALPDMLVLLTGSRGRHVVMLPLPKRALTEPEHWDECGRFVLRKVPLHPYANRALRRTPFWNPSPGSTGLQSTP